MPKSKMLSTLAALSMLVPQASLPARAPPDTAGIWRLDLRQPTTRPLVVVMTQNGLEADYHSQFTTGTTPGCNTCVGLGPNIVSTAVTGLLMREMAAASARRDAEVLDLMTIMSVALKHFDLESKIADATAAVTQVAAWIGAPPVEVSKEDTNASFSQLLDSTHSPDLFVARYHHRFVEHFAVLEIDSEVALLNSAALRTDEPAASASFKHAPYLRHVTYFVPLHPKPIPQSADVFRGHPVTPPVEDDVTNARRWAQDGAKSFVRALNLVVAKSVALVGRAVSITPQEEIDSVRARPKTEACGGRMRVIEKDPEGELCAKADLVWVYEFIPVDVPDEPSQVH